jgi:hypothetical protein
MRRLGWKVLAVLLDLISLAIACMVGASLAIPYLLTFGGVAAGDAIPDGYAPSLWQALVPLVASSLTLAGCIWLRRIVLRRALAPAPALRSAQA